MKPLAKPAIEAVKKGRIKFYPERWTKVYLNWMENIQDWCISRQIWWGHRLPVYYCRECQEASKSQNLPPNQLNRGRDPALTPGTLGGKKSKINDGVIVSCIRPEKCPDCGSANIHQDEDVLDTWFSSWLWPFATFYWPEEAKSRQELKYFYPTSVLVTAPEIIFFWVARMIMAGIEFMGDIPFRHVYIHGTVRDIEGKKMSKSLGNIIDPLEIINEYGTDALRFSLISITAQGQDVFLSKERFEQGRNFANKIWNASRFILMNLDGALVKKDLCVIFQKEKLNMVNRWILSRFYSVLSEVNKDLEIYRFNEAANALYSFFWHEFCDWYLEIIKPDMKNPHNQLIMYKILEKFLRALHPFMPFVTEEIWQRLSVQKERVSIMVESLPHIQEQMIDKKLEKQAQFIFEVITQIRNLRSSIEVKPDQKVTVSIYSHSKIKQNLLKDNFALIINLAKLEDLKLLESAKRPAAAMSTIIEDVDIYLHFSGLVDLAKEQSKIREKISNLEASKKSKIARLKNQEFIKKAPQEVVDKEKESITKLEDDLKRLEKMADELH
jgi:valyl-tRNA synthetase